MNVFESSATTSLIEGDAQEFGLHLKEGGWRLGLLVARSVEPGLQGNQHVPAANDAGKVSASQFGRFAFGHENGENRVMRYYRAWERAAEKGKVPHSSELSPGQEPDLDWPRLPPWKTFFSPGFSDGGATGPLNLAIKLGSYGDKLLKSHRSLIHFIATDMQEQKPAKSVRQLAGDYAAAHEAEAAMLRRIEAGENPSAAEVKTELDPSKFFRTV